MDIAFSYRRVLGVPTRGEFDDVIAGSSLTLQIARRRDARAADCAQAGREERRGASDPPLQSEPGNSKDAMLPGLLPAPLCVSLIDLTLFNGRIHQVAPFRPASVVVANILEAEQVFQHKPRV